MLGQELCHCFIPSRLLCCWTHLHVWKLSLREVKSQSIKAEPVFHSGLDGLLAEILPLGPGLRSPCFYQCPLQSLLSSEWPDHPQVEDAFSRLRILSGSQLTLDDESPHRGAGRGQGVGAGPSSSHFLLGIKLRPSHSFRSISGCSSSQKPLLPSMACRAHPLGHVYVIHWCLAHIGLVI